MFIVFEGLDGCGKTTQMKLLEDRLKNDEIDNIVTFREPGSFDESETIRRLILDFDLNDIQKLFLFLSARNIVVENGIKPSLRNGDIVLCDRYTPSTLAYQGYGKKLADIDLIHKMNNLACENIQPDYVIFIDVNAEKCLKRQNKHDKMEESVFDVYDQIYNGYKQLSKNNNWIVVDGTKTIEEISDEIYNIVKSKLKNDR